MPSILISEFTVKVNYSNHITVQYCILCETHVKCGIKTHVKGDNILEVSTGSHVAASAWSCHSVLPIPIPSPCKVQR